VFRETVIVVSIRRKLGIDSAVVVGSVRRKLGINGAEVGWSGVCIGNSSLLGSCSHIVVGWCVRSGSEANNASEGDDRLHLDEDQKNDCWVNERLI
jgi:hypothetical protein